MMESLTEEDKEMLRYFWNGYHDVERWSDWPAKKELVARDMPIFYAAWTTFLHSKKVIAMAIEQE